MVFDLSNELGPGRIANVNARFLQTLVLRVFYRIPYPHQMKIANKGLFIYLPGIYLIFKDFEIRLSFIMCF